MKASPNESSRRTHVRCLLERNLLDGNHAHPVQKIACRRALEPLCLFDAIQGRAAIAATRSLPRFLTPAVSVSDQQHERCESGAAP